MFLGAELGGRPPEPELYDTKGHARYDLMMRTERFGAGLERLLTGAGLAYRWRSSGSEEDRPAATGGCW